jgi:hypothetical protein
MCREHLSKCQPGSFLSGWQFPGALDDEVTSVRSKW